MDFFRTIVVAAFVTECEPGVGGIMASPVIYHVDVNSAFLSWEAACRISEGYMGEDLRTIPAVVGGSQATRHGIVLAKSLPARAYGIQTGEPLVSARSKCPNLVVVPPRYEVYVDYSRALMELLRRYSPKVEQYSIDEAFCDMTGMEYINGPPMAFAEELRVLIREELGFTVNIGVSSNKLLAKMASDFKKPDRVHSLWPEEVPTKMWPLPVGDLFFVGHRTEEKLHTLGILTIGDLARADESMLVAVFKSFGRTLHSFSQGVDDGTAAAICPVNKGYGNSITVPYDIKDCESAALTILSLTETVGARIRSDHAFISVVAISIVDNDFHYMSHQMTLLSATDVTEVIYRAAMKLFREAWTGIPIRQIGVHTSRATQNGMYQYNLLDGSRYDRLSALSHAVDEIRARYGDDSVKRACFINSPVHHMGGGVAPSRRTAITGKEV